MGVTVWQPVHHKTQRRCSTEEVSFVVKPYVAQYLWLVTVFVIFVCLLYFFSVCQCCKYAFFMCAEVVCTNVFLLSDHQIFVCFFLCWRTDKNKQKKKSCSDPTPPFPASPASPQNEEPPPPPPHQPAHNHNHQSHQAVTNKNHQLCTVMSTSFLDFCTFCTSRLNIPLIVFSMHQKRGKHPPKILKSFCSYRAPPLCYYYLHSLLKRCLKYGMQTFDIYLIPRQNLLKTQNLFMTFLLTII